MSCRKFMFYLIPLLRTIGLIVLLYFIITDIEFLKAIELWIPPIAFNVISIASVCAYCSNRYTRTISLIMLTVETGLLIIFCCFSFPNRSRLGIPMIILLVFHAVEVIMHCLVPNRTT
ncbi:hypothetical protein ACOME3_005349 [Neoechinorhynchus agilis]